MKSSLADVSRRPSRTPRLRARQAGHNAQDQQ